LDGKKSPDQVQAEKEMEALRIIVTEEFLSDHSPGSYNPRKKGGGKGARKMNHLGADTLDAYFGGKRK